MCQTSGLFLSVPHEKKTSGAVPRQRVECNCVKFSTTEYTEASANEAKPVAKLAYSGHAALNTEHGGDTKTQRDLSVSIFNSEFCISSVPPISARSVLSGRRPRQMPGCSVVQMQTRTLAEPALGSEWSSDQPGNGTTGQQLTTQIITMDTHADVRAAG